MFILGFLLRRSAQGVVIIFLVSLLIFTLLRVVPGDPVRLMAGGMAPPALIEQIATTMGLRDPIPVQFGRYMGRVLRGDLGQSFVRPANGAATGGASFNDTTRGERAKVLDLVLDTLPKTLQLAAVAIGMALAFSLAIGIPGGLAPGRWPDRLAFYVASIFISLPNFWLGIVLALVFSVKLGWLPAIGYGGFSYTILPAIVLAIAVLGVSRPTIPAIILVLGLSGWPTYARVTRSVAMTERKREYVRAAVVMGASHGRILFRLLAPLILPPIVFVSVLDIARMMIFESILGFIGLGVQPPTPTFGNIIADGRKYLLNAWWIATMPGAFLCLTLVSINLMGTSFERARNRIFGGA